MATEKLVKIRLLGLQRQKAKVLDFLQQEGFLHLNPAEHLDNVHKLERDTPLSIIDDISQALLELRWAEEHLRPYAKKTRTYPFSEMTVQQALRQVKELKARYHKQLEGLVRQRDELATERKEAAEHLRILRDIPFKLGKAPLVSEGNLVFSHLLIAPEDETVDLPSLLEGKTVHIITSGRYSFVQGLAKDLEEIDRTLKQAGMVRVKVPPITVTKAKEIAALDKRIAKADAGHEKVVEQLSRLSKRYLADIRQAQFVMEIFHDRYEATTSSLRTQATFLLEGYVPIKRMRDLKRLAEHATVHIDELELDEAPSKLRNFPYVKHFEFITKMFGLPGYGAVDPTLYISIFLPLFFGFMFSDIGYGLLLLVGALFMLARSHERVPILRDAGIVLGVCAFMTILFGWILGAFFGNLVPIEPLARTVIADFDSFQSALIILIAALAFGLLHLNIGIVTDIVERLRVKDYKGFVLGPIAILCLEVGGALLALGLPTTGYYLLAVSLALLLRKAGLMGVMDITGFIGTWFSYARLLALSLATGGIALAVNILGELLGGLGVIGPVLLVIMLVFGHLFNFVLNVLGSSINSVRLHYIEFFSQFYEGGGKPFQAYSTKRVKDTL